MINILEVTGGYQAVTATYAPQAPPIQFIERFAFYVRVRVIMMTAMPGNMQTSF